jgi:4-amino-4-deoxy-L-arabinose transferase-like glycosyltransferase
MKRRRPRAADNHLTSSAGLKVPVAAHEAFNPKAAVLLFAAALLVRLIHFFFVRQYDPFFHGADPIFDMGTYCNWAKSIAGGDYLSAKFTKGGPFFFGPVYPYFLSLFFIGGSGHFQFIHLAQGLIGSVVPVLVYDASRHVFSRPVPVIAGILAVCCAPVIFYEQVLLMEGLVYALYAVLFWCLIRGANSDQKIGWYAAAGFTAGVLTLARSNLLLLLPLFLVLIWRDYRALPGSTRKAMAAFILPCLFVLAASTARNVAVSGRWVVTTSNGPMNLYIGNAPDSIGSLDLPDSADFLIQRYGDQEKVPWMTELKERISDNPLYLIPLFLKKFYIFWNSYDPADNVSYYAFRPYYPLIRLNPVGWLLLVSLGFMGAVLTRKFFKKQVIFYLYVLGFSVSIALVFVLGRYRLPVLLPLYAWSAAAILQVVNFVQQKRFREVSASLAAWVVIVLLLLPRWSPAARINNPAALPRVSYIRLNDYINFAHALFIDGKREMSVEVLERASGEYPDVPEVVGNLSREYLLAGRAESAIKLLETFRRDKGNASAALKLLAEAYHDSGNSAKEQEMLQLLQENGK